MKRLILALLALGFVNTASAESDSARVTALDWVRAQLMGRDKLEFNGVTSLGRACALFLTDRSYGDHADYFVVVGYPLTVSMNNYIGLLTSASQVKAEPTTFDFSSDQSWGNQSKENRVQIILDEQKNPIRAIGKSDLREIDCKLR